MILLQLTKTFLLIILLMGASACDSSDENNIYEGWDANQDDLVDEEEFYSGITATGYHASIDLNSDGNVSDQEFVEGFYTAWDTDGDGVIDQAEWNNKLPEVGGDSPLGGFRDYDADRDQALTYEEFRRNFSDTEFFQEMDEDGDGSLDDEDLSSAMFFLWDHDGDGYVESAEFEEWYGDYLTESD
jgi:Ca2+-binding EF-hand superfamily protein